jgi:hypothetical protein
VCGIKAENRAFLRYKTVLGLILLTFVDAKFTQFIKESVIPKKQKHMVESEYIFKSYSLHYRARSRNVGLSILFISEFEERGVRKICYYHQDLHQGRLQPGSHPKAFRATPATFLLVEASGSLRPALPLPYLHMVESE